MYETVTPSSSAIVDGRLFPPALQQLAFLNLRASLAEHLRPRAGSAHHLLRGILSEVDDE
jgi:hypothetical protein